jgi:DNA-binding LytR/AlgR family response regulator
MGHYTVLIVEDEALFADQVEMMLEQIGCSVAGVADNSEVALQIVEEHPPHLILMDIAIQGAYDGIELSAYIQEHWAIPILFMTAFKDDLTFRRASRIKPVGFLTKPFDLLQLQRSVELALLEQEAPRKAPLPFQDHFYLKHLQQIERVDLKAIVYLKADGRYTEIHTLQKKYLHRIPLGELVSRLPAGKFILTHRSYAVNQDFITGFNLEEMTVATTLGHLPISKRNKEATLNALPWLK